MLLTDPTCRLDVERTGSFEYLPLPYLRANGSEGISEEAAELVIALEGAGMHRGSVRYKKTMSMAVYSDSVRGH